MRRLRQVLGALAVVLVVLPAGATASAAEDTSAVAVNLQDGRSVFRLAFQIKRTMDAAVDNDNAAVAFASCDSCQTVAISIQVVLAMADTSEVTTDNLALAYNYECSECETLAAAYQYVFATGEPVRLSAEGSRQVADIRRRLQTLRHEDLPIEEIARRVDELAAELSVVLQEELVARSPEQQPDGAQATTTTTTPPDGETSTTTSTTSDSTTTTESPSTTAA